MIPALFQPYQLKNLTLRNRIVVSPMCQYSSTDGFANNWHLVHLGAFATGGASLIITEAAGVSPEGRISAHDLGIWKDDHIEKLKEITDFIHQQGAIAGIQLAHAGRKASNCRPWEGREQIAPDAPNGWQTVAPSAIPFKPTEHPPLELDKAGIETVKADFKAAAARALKAGFKVIELHAAHGYLQHQFLSPLSNTRTDEYGGSLENRARLLMETITAVQEVWPADLPLLVRISATDWADGGWNLEESIELSKWLKAAGVDLIDTSTSGNIYNAKIVVKPGYQVEFAAAIRKEADAPTGAVGLITSASQANDIIANGEADLVLLAREMLRDPHFPLRAAHELGHQIEWPPQYERAKWPAVK